ncbi:hypothetical protein NLJ89_g6532 [Agrocybe chaxingu]|uniref:Uncharacterized protein n=1 Tax=Agrocybe chaxingu TaxID=84603 RepID=A0A9W8MUJ2_9AGAR|nr:hypothetical protein NLJ89_g6532 [Agrocybe chaxingu]
MENPALGIQTSISTRYENLYERYYAVRISVAINEDEEEKEDGQYAPSDVGSDENALSASPQPKRQWGQEGDAPSYPQEPNHQDEDYPDGAHAEETQGGYYEGACDEEGCPGLKGLKAGILVVTIKDRAL